MLCWVSLGERFRVSFFFSVQKCLDLHWNLGNVNGMEGNAAAGGLISSIMKTIRNKRLIRPY